MVNEPKNILNMSSLRKKFTELCACGSVPSKSKIAVEPSRHYLDSLPTRTGVKKINAAIITETSTKLSDGSVAMLDRNGQRTVSFYYIPEEVIDRLGLFYYLKGCNSVGDYHAGHREFNVTQHVVIEQVPALTITEFLRQERIHHIHLLKTDAEGYDLTIMEELYQHITSRVEPVLRVDRIMFETNDDAQQQRTQDIIENFKKLGYTVVMTGENTVIEKLV